MAADTRRGITTKTVLILDSTILLLPIQPLPFFPSKITSIHLKSAETSTNNLYF